MHLEAAIVDFRAYLRSLMSLYHLNGLSQYYIHPLLEGGQDLESTVTDWISGSSDRPMAIIAGYGMGKSSFASRLAFLSAEEYLAGAPTRIPIMIPLAEIASEQGLEGLLGKRQVTTYTNAARHRWPSRSQEPSAGVAEAGRHPAYR